MLSRVAENLYWIGRYLERAEATARLIDDAFHLELDAAEAEGEEGSLGGVLDALGVRAEFANHGKGHDAALHFLTFDRRGGQSILSMIARARENARAVQETLSTEAWSQMNRLYLALSGRQARRRFAASPSRFCHSIGRACTLFVGLIDGTMPRTEAFHFLRAGRFLERGDFVCRAVALKVQALPETRGLAPYAVQLTSLLRCCSAYEAYLKSYQDRIDSGHVVQYLILAPHVPRAARFCVDRCLDSLRELAGSNDEEYGSEPERLLGRLVGELRYTSVDEILGRGITPFLGGVQTAFARVHHALGQAYFLT